MTKRRQISLLPPVHQTDALKRFFASTVDPLFQDGKTVPVSGYIGRKPAHYDQTKDFYKPEPTPARERYQLEPVMISADQDGNILSQLFYEDLLSRLNQEGAITSNPNRLFGAGYYSWAPPIDIDRIMNFQQYYWAGALTTALELVVPGVEIGTRVYANGTDKAFAIPKVLPSRDTSEEDVTVLVDGVIVTNWTRSGDEVLFEEALPRDSLVVIFRYGNVSDGTRTVYLVPQHCKASEGSDDVFVFLNGRETTEFVNNGDTISLNDAAPAHTHVMVTRIKDLKARIEGGVAFDPTGLTARPVTALLNGMKLRLVDPVNFLIGYDLKSYGHPWDEIHYSTFFVEGVDIAITLIRIEDVMFTGDGWDADDPRYVVVARNDRTRSYWSRVNRWVHKDALIEPADATFENRAKRPIIEFLENLQQFNYGSYRVQNCSGKVSAPPIYGGEAIAFTEINGLPEGSVAIDGGFVPMKGDFIIVNLPNSPLNNRIYHVDVVIPENDPLNSLYLLEPLDPLEEGAVTSIRFDEYWFDGRHWNAVGNPGDYPLFDLFDADGISLADPGVYPDSTFAGSRLFNFAIGMGRPDVELKRPVRYDRYGQIMFENELETRRYSYRDGDISGYYYYSRNNVFENAWHKANDALVQKIDENNVSEIPLNLQANPDFDTPKFLSRNDWFGHFTSILENQDGFEGKSYAGNNWNYTAKDVTKGLVIIQHEAPLLKLMALMESRDLSVRDALNFNEREYTRFKAKFLKHVRELSREMDLDIMSGDAIADAALKRVNAGKTISFPFYDSTVGGSQFFIPLTPSLIGMMPLVQPAIVVDDTFGERREFIRGHDGSMTAKFGDARDEALLALETRIFNAAGSPEDRMPMHALVNGRYRTDALYDEAELVQIMMPLFERWARENGVSYENQNFDEADPFSWNYRSSTDRYGNACRGHWRGIYRHFFDTDKPHLAPWEMLGFAERPVWWVGHYGEAPYTRANTILWDDIQAGIIREGDRAGTHPEFARDDLMQILPIDLQGRLVDPVTATIILQAPPIQFARAGWQFGDGSDLEALWRNTSTFGFAMAMVKFLMRPAFFVERFWDILNETVVHGDQTVQLPEMRRIHHHEMTVSGELIGDQTKKTIGLQNWIVDHLIHRGLGPSRLGDVIRGLRAQLGHKVAGFTTPDRMTISAESFGLVPDEDITISLYSSPSMTEYFYSGILIENTPTGWRVVGYNPDYPFFDIVEGEEAGKKIRITHDGSTERVVNPWQPAVYYKRDMLVDHENTVFRCVTPHTSGRAFEESFWEVDQQGGQRSPTVVMKHLRSSGVRSRIEYGTEFRSKQEIADLLFGYERYLVEQGFVFGENENDPNSWTAAVRNFLKWSEVEWAAGAFVTLSPSARELHFHSETGMVVELQDAIIDRTGHTFKKEDFSVDRYDEETIITAHSDDIYGARLSKTEIEHCLIFSNRTIFDDVIYDALYNIRQDRLKVSARLASNWAGRYDAPGFVLDGNAITPNFVKLGEDIREMFDIELADNTTLRDHARHVIGFETRDYLDKLLLNETQQFELYQGMIQHKGSKGSLATILRSDEVGQSRNLEFLEEWAFRIGTYGAYFPTFQIELLVRQSDIHSDRQIVHLDDTGKPDWLNAGDRWVSAPMDFTDLLTTQPSETLPDAGYVRLDEVTYLARSQEAFGELVAAREAVYEGETVWLTHDEHWSVQRLSHPTTDHLPITILAIEDEMTGAIDDVRDYRVQFNRAHDLSEGDFFILTEGEQADFRGIHEVLRTGEDWVETSTLFGTRYTEDDVVVMTPPTILRLENMRCPTTTERDLIPHGTGTLAYVDDLDGKWAVYKKLADSWVEARRQPKVIENKKLTSSKIYDPGSVLGINTLAVQPAVPEQIIIVDPLVGLLPGLADRELDYKLEYDPADYDTWGEDELGMTWWDVSTARFTNVYTDVVENTDHDSERYAAEIAYRAAHWGSLLPTSTVDIYEWSRSLTPPMEGEYTQRSEYETRLNKTVTAYYYWTLNPSVTPRTNNRRLSAKSVSEIISNPSRAGIIWLAAISDQALVLGGAKPFLEDSGRILQVDYQITDHIGDEHSEWLLMRPKDKSTEPPARLWNKMVESLRGFNLDMKGLPAASLHPTERSGLEKMQSMFGDVATSASRNSFITMLNYILARKNFSDVGLLEEKLSLADTPSEFMTWSIHSGDLPILPLANDYDALVYTEEERDDSLRLFDRVLLDNRGADTPSWSVWQKDEDGNPVLARSYDHVVNTIAERDALFPDLNFKERVLVLNDERADGFWTIWRKDGEGAWAIDPFDTFRYDSFSNVNLALVNAQKYRTRDMWYYADWFRSDISSAFPPPVTYETIAERTIGEGEQPLNNFVKIVDDAGYWSWTKFEDGEWRVVARENGTIQLDEAFFASSKLYGYEADEQKLDITKVRGRDGSLDFEPLLSAISSLLLTKEELNELWFSMVHFVHSTIDKVDWAAKTSFLSVMGFNERLWAAPVAVTDNMPLLLDYIDEVKPYRVKVREILRTAAPDIDIANTIATDFDKPVYFDPQTEEYRRLDENIDADILSKGAYRHRAEHMDKVRKTKIAMLFDRIWHEDTAGSGAAERIMAYYQPGSNMRAKSLDDLLSLDFKGTVYEGKTLADVDIILKGGTADESQIDVVGGALRDPARRGKPEELVKVGAGDGLLFRAHDRWGDGAPQHIVRHYDISRRRSAKVKLDVGILADSIAVFRDGVRAAETDYNFNALTHTVEVDAVVNGTRVKTVAIHAFGFAAVDRIKDQRYYVGGGTDFELPDAYTALVEVSVNGELLPADKVTTDLNTVTLADSTTASDAVMMTLYSTEDPKPIRQVRTTLPFTETTTWQLDELPSQKPYHANMIVEVNGLRLTPPKTLYTVEEDSIFVDIHDHTRLFVYDDRTEAAHPVVPVTDITSEELADVADVIAAAGDERFVLWNERIVFCDPRATSSSYAVVIMGDQDFTISDDGELVITKVVAPEDRIEMTHFANSDKMDMRTHVYPGNPNGFYTLRTKKNGRTWLTIAGKRLVENVDYSIEGTMGGAWDIDPFEAQSFDVFTTVQIAIRFPGELPAQDVVITTFEGKENNPASSWQMSTTTPSEMRLLPVEEGETAMYVVRDAWEIISLDEKRRAGLLVGGIDSEFDTITAVLNPESIPDAMMPPQPLPVPTEHTPGVVWIGSERIEYFDYSRDGDAVTLKQLRRGTRGTAKLPHAPLSLVLAGDALLDRLPPCPPDDPDDCGCDGDNSGNGGGGGTGPKGKIEPKVTPTAALTGKYGLDPLGNMASEVSPSATLTGNHGSTGVMTSAIAITASLTASGSTPGPDLTTMTLNESEDYLPTEPLLNDLPFSLSFPLPSPLPTDHTSGGGTIISWSTGFLYGTEDGGTGFANLGGNWSSVNGFSGMTSSSTGAYGTVTADFTIADGQVKIVFTGDRPMSLLPTNNASNYITITIQAGPMLDSSYDPAITDKYGMVLHNGGAGSFSYLTSTYTDAGSLRTRQKKVHTALFNRLKPFRTPATEVGGFVTTYTVPFSAASGTTE